MMPLGRCTRQPQKSLLRPLLEVGLYTVQRMHPWGMFEVRDAWWCLENQALWQGLGVPHLRKLAAHLDACETCTGTCMETLPKRIIAQLQPPVATVPSRQWSPTGQHALIMVLTVLSSWLKASCAMLHCRQLC
jgi:hypothetical protein